MRNLVGSKTAVQVNGKEIVVEGFYQQYTNLRDSLVACSDKTGNVLSVENISEDKTYNLHVFLQSLTTIPPGVTVRFQGEKVQLSDFTAYELDEDSSAEDCND